jgi:hypothetical protein
MTFTWREDCFINKVTKYLQERPMTLRLKLMGESTSVTKMSWLSEMALKVAKVGDKH